MNSTRQGSGRTARSASSKGRSGAAPAGRPGPAGAGGGGPAGQRRADVVQLAGELFAQKGFRADLDPRLTYRLLRDVLWIPSQWRVAGGYGTDQVADALLRLLFDGISAPRS